MKDNLSQEQDDDAIAQDRRHQMEKCPQNHHQLEKDPSEHGGVPPDHFIPINRQEDVSNRYVEEDLEEIGEGEIEEEYSELSPRQLPTESMPTTICFVVQKQKAETQASANGDGNKRPPPQMINGRPERPSHPPPPEEEKPIDPSETKKLTAELESESNENGIASQSHEKNETVSDQDLPDDSSATVLLTQSKNVFHNSSSSALKPNTLASSGTNKQVERASAFHPILPVFQDVRQFQQPQSKSLTKPVQTLSNVPEKKEPHRSTQVYRPRPKRPYQNADDDDHRSAESSPSVRSEFLLSQTQDRPNKSRRITASPRVLPKSLTDLISEKSGQENNRKDKNTAGRRASSTRWISNEPARDFLKPTSMKAEKTTPRNANSTRTNPYAEKTSPVDPTVQRKKSNHSAFEKTTTTNPYPRRETSNSNASKTTKEPDSQSRDLLAKEASKLRSKLSNTSSRPFHGKSAKKKISNDWLNDSDESDKDDEPDFKYTEVVRKKTEREALNGYHCQDCIAFANQVMQGKGAEVFDRQELMRCSRHRGRFTPPSSPAGFWELSFADSILKKERKD
jgi:hypothetical protein